ncbi:MAG: PD-(D/E)XK nuclease family protein [Verrucomicrobia bacterium]|nr:PD-(D/E)XK nuclease family protein [Verrucomicrobiota bacterium]
MPVSKVYIGWSESFAPRVAQEILAVTKNDKIPSGQSIDLSKHRIIVPSQFAGRLIREQLAIQSPHGILLPKIETPESFLNWGDRNLEIATQETCLLAWMQILMSENFNRTDYPHLFPVETDRGFDFSSAQVFAQQLMNLRDQLGGSRIAHNFKKVSEICQEEPQRWEDLARLEFQYLTLLNRMGKADHNQLRTTLATSDDMPEGVETVWLVGLLDPQPLLLEALHRRQDRLNIQLIIGADASEADAFDNWGRPDTEYWKNHRSSWANFEQTVHVVHHPEHGLNRLSQILQNQKPAYGTTAIVPCERERYPAMISDRLKSLGAESLNPMGELHGDHIIHHSLNALCQVIENPTFANLRKILLYPTLTENLLSQPIDFLRLNELLDALSQRKPPQNLSQLVDFADQIEIPHDGDKREIYQAKQIKSLTPLLKEIVQRIHSLPKDPKTLGQTLLLLVQKKTPDADKLAHEFTLEVSDTIEETLHHFCQHDGPDNQLSAIEWIKLTLSVCGQERFRKSDVTHPINLPGWMEAVWEPVPHLIIFGLTDDLIPQSNHSHPFLPARLRRALQLSTAENHFANAAYSLERIRRSRPQGRVDIIVPRHNSDGDGLRPSRLLFQCTDDELVQRVHYLFESELATESEPFWNIPANLRLTPIAKPQQLERVQKRISATAFRNYLSNPADFWLKNVLQLQETHHDTVELNHAEFGSLVHSALEKFGREESNRTLRNAQEIADKLSQCLDDYFAEAFGNIDDNNDPEYRGILLQRETARDRLTRFAPLQAQLVEEGWLIQSVEGELPTLTIGKMEVGGRYDRLDYNAQKDLWRVYDYKSFNRVNTPEKKHFTELKANSKRNPDFEFESGGTRKNGEAIFCRWDDLQLPVYYRNLRQGNPEIAKSQGLEIGYIVLPEDGPAEANLWENYQKVETKANAAIEKIVQRIQQARPEFFAFERDGTYPVFPHFSKRKPESYMDVTKLGTTEDSGQ